MTAAVDFEAGMTRAWTTVADRAAPSADLRNAVADPMPVDVRDGPVGRPERPRP